MAKVDVVVVSYNSSGRLRRCVEPLTRDGRLSVLVVDNDSDDDGLREIRDLSATTIALSRNFGFAYGCNRGFEAGTSPYVLFLNPDARATAESIVALAHVLDVDASCGAVAPRIVDEHGRLDFSQRRFPRLRSTYARALFLHRALGGREWVDEVIRDERLYGVARDAEWVSGACILVRRSALERLGGLDESFFMYCEDTDLCRRLWDEGLSVRFTPDVTIAHEGGASAPRSALLPVLAESRRRYAEKHMAPHARLAEQFGVALESAIRVVVSRGGLPSRRGHALAVAAALGASGRAT